MAGRNRLSGRREADDAELEASRPRILERLAAIRQPRGAETDGQTQVAVEADGAGTPTELVESAPESASISSDAPAAGGAAGLVTEVPSVPTESTERADLSSGPTTIAPEATMRTEPEIEPLAPEATDLVPEAAEITGSHTAPDVPAGGEPATPRVTIDGPGQPGKDPQRHETWADIGVRDAGSGVKSGGPRLGRPGHTSVASIPASTAPADDVGHVSVSRAAAVAAATPSKAPKVPRPRPAQKPGPARASSEARKAGEPRTAEEAGTLAGPRTPAEPRSPAAPPTPGGPRTPAGAQTPPAPRPSTSRVPKEVGAQSARQRLPERRAPVAMCPYCAAVLKPPPTATRRCPRCRQRIVVKRVGDRRVYLAEAAVPVFDAERRRLSNAGRWSALRDRWLELALKAGADERRASRIARDPVSELVVEAARSLYVTAADRAFRAARHDRRWDDAARIRFEQALAVHRVGGSPVPPSTEVIRLHREGVAASLRGIGGVAPEAELRAGRCCDACHADDGFVVRVDSELRAARLPHPACPKGLCACRWYIPPRHQEAVRAFLRRQAAARRTDSA